MSFSELPLKVVEYVFANLSLYQLKNLSHTCKLFNIASKSVYAKRLETHKNAYSLMRSSDDGKYDESVCIISYGRRVTNNNEELDYIGYVYVKWRGYAKSEQFRRVFQDMVNYLHIYGTDRSLMDARELKLVTKADEDWMVAKFAPFLSTTVFHKAAVIRSKFFFAQRGINQAQLATSSSRLLLENFDNFEDAYRFLAIP